MLFKVLSKYIELKPKADIFLNSFVDTVNKANQDPATVIALYAEPHLEKIGGKTQLFGTLRTATPTDYHTGFIVDKKPQAKINSCTTVALTNNETAAFGTYTFTLHDSIPAQKVEASYIFVWNDAGKIIHHHSANQDNSDGIESIREPKEKGFETKEVEKLRLTTLYTGTHTITLQSNP